MKKSKIAIFLLFLPFWLFSQQRTITGNVTDEMNETIPGVNIVIAGTTVGTITDLDGDYQLRVPEGKVTLTFSFVGMQSKTIDVAPNQNILNVSLQSDAQLLDEMVVVGYAVQRKESVVGAIGSAKADDLKMQGNITNMTDALTGVIPGVSVLSISGMPGGDFDSGTRIYSPSEILIRGKTTWNNSSPLILVDGIERQMNEIDISEVESISVLKDASATAVFGVKGGNGVILITTKRGKEGKTKFNIEAEVSFEAPSKIIASADTPEGMIARNYAIERIRRFNNGLWNELYTSDQEIEYYRNGKLPYAYPNNNWHDIMLKDFTTSYRVNTTASGGTDRVKYFAAASYNHVGDLFNTSDVGQGYVPSYSYDRLNIRSNFDFDITNSTKLSANFSGMYGVQTSPSRNALEGAFTSVYTLAGETPVFIYEDGVYGSEDGRFHSVNPFYDINMKGLRTYPRTIINMDYTLNQKLDFITQGLSFSAKLAFDNTFRNRGKSINDVGLTTKTISKDFYLNGGYYDYETNTYILNGVPANMNEWTTYDEPSPGREGFGWVKTPNTYDPEGVTLESARRGLYYELQLHYERSIDRHSLGAMAMFSRNQVEVGSNWPSKREDWVGRITYDYDQRYLMEVNGAYNGSEKFGPDYRFDFFPSIAAGWMISNENFIKNNVEWVDALKIRYSYGLVGNDNLNTGSTWPYLTIWDIYSVNSHEENYYGYPTPYKEYIRYNEGNPGNPNLRWEKAKKQNLGIEFTSFNYKFSLTADIFNERRTDMLIGASDRSKTVPPIFGKPAPPANLGEAKSHGAEFEFIYRDSFKSTFNYWLSFNWAVARSEVIYKESSELTLPHQRPEGKPLNQTYSGVSSGIINSWDELYSIPGGASAADNSFLMPGDMAMIDFNADGRYYDVDDDVPYGYPSYPQNNYGVAFGGDYKGFDLSARLVGAYNTTRKIATELFYYDNVYSPTFILDNTWTPEYHNNNPTYPALALKAKTYNPTGEFFQYDGSFLRLQSVQVGYSLPKRYIQSLGISNLKLYVNGRNLFLWTKMPNDGVGMDDPGKNYPTKRQLNMGLNIQF